MKTPITSSKFDQRVHKTFQIDSFIYLTLVLTISQVYMPL